MGVDGRTYRVVAGDVYAGKFSSDRRHMRGQDGEWNSPPPVWEVIRNGGMFCEYRGHADLDCEDNLQGFIDMGEGTEGYGTVLRETEFLEFCKYSPVDDDVTPTKSAETKS